MKESKHIQPVLIHKGHIKAESTAKHYGFSHFGQMHVTKQDLLKAKNFKDSKKNSFNDKDSVLSFDNLLEEKIAITRTYLEKQMAEVTQPPMIYFSGPLDGNPHATGDKKSDSKSSKSKLKTFNIDIVANPKSIADAIVIETSYIILKEHLDSKDAELMIEINSIGDKDSFAKFNKEFTTFCKKRLSELPTEWRNAFKKDPLSLFKCTDEACSILLDEAPKPMSYLSEASRDHFREVLEYIESLSLPYIINHSLIGSKHYSSGTIFQIVKITNEELKTGKKVERREVQAIGERYNTVSKKAWGKKEIPAIGATMLVDEKSLKNMKIPAKPAKQQEIRFYFIQLGYDAKLKSLSIIEMLRLADIAVHQSLSRDKITSQLAAAEKMGVPYILILGQKEAIEGSVTIRHMNTRVQDTVLIHELVEYLKKLK
jgi:histidyl-tRNA synthetase